MRDLTQLTKEELRLISGGDSFTGGAALAVGGIDGSEGLASLGLGAPGGAGSCRPWHRKS